MLIGSAYDARVLQYLSEHLANRKFVTMYDAKVLSVLNLKSHPDKMQVWIIRKIPSLELGVCEYSEISDITRILNAIFILALKTMYSKEFE